MENKGLQMVIDMTKTMCDCFEHIDVDKQTILKYLKNKKLTLIELIIVWFINLVVK